MELKNLIEIFCQLETKVKTGCNSVKSVLLIAVKQKMSGNH